MSLRRVRPLKRRIKASFTRSKLLAIATSTTLAMETETLRHQAREDDDGFEDIDDDIQNPAGASPAVPRLFTHPPPITDDYLTPSLNVQDETMQECLPLLAATADNVEHNRHGIPRLRREAHVKFLRKQLGGLPAPFLIADASRPWFLFWCINGLALLGEDVSAYRQQLVETARSMQNPSGGFGGGHGQTSHLATTFAVVLALSVVGGEAAYDVVDRKGMWKWLSSLKQPDGGVQMAYGGEVDVR